MVSVLLITREKWEGPIVGPDDAVNLLGIDEVSFKENVGNFQFFLGVQLGHAV